MKESPLALAMCGKVDGCEQKLADTVRRFWAASWILQPSRRGERTGFVLELRARVGQTSVAELLTLLQRDGGAVSCLRQVRVSTARTF